MEKDSEETDYKKILIILTTKENEGAVNFDDKLQRILKNSIPLLPEEIKNFLLNGTEEIRFKYLYVLANVLKSLQKIETDDSYFSVHFFRTIKTSVEIIVSLGILPNLLRGVGIETSKLCPRLAENCDEKLTDYQKHQRLKFSVNSLIEIYGKSILRPAIISQISPLLAALLQLSYVPLSKASLNPPEKGFHMSFELYEKLSEDQRQFRGKLNDFLEDSPRVTITRELMAILGGKDCPNWLRREIRKLLDDRIIRPGGIIELFAAVCEDFNDLGQDWNKLETLARLLAMPRGKNTEIYYDAVCPQIIDLLSSKAVKHAPTIANCCIVALYDCNREICLRKIVEKISEPLLTRENARWSEKDVGKCLENLTNSFLSPGAKFRRLPCYLLQEISVPLFSLYLATRKSVFALKTNLKNLLLKFLENFPDLNSSFSRQHLFSAFLSHDSTLNFGKFVKTRFASDAGIEIIGLEESLDPEELVDGLYDLISANADLSNDLFCYLLKYLIDSRREKTVETSLKTLDDHLSLIQRQLAVGKLLSTLSNTCGVRERQRKNPRQLLGFVRSLFENYLSKEAEDDDTEILYTSLMLVKTIVSDVENSQAWETFDNLAKYLNNDCRMNSLPPQLSDLMTEVVKVIASRGKIERKCYDDFSADRKDGDEFSRALRELADPLLPVRAHALMTLTKLIDGKDPCITGRKDLIFTLFQENLKHEDSFLYLAAVNGISALATSFPDSVIKVLVEEFVKENVEENVDEFRSETRMKLGEVLVKTTRILGEMAVKHKNLLINGFLCATRDPDPLVRASSLSCLGELCKVLGFRLGNVVIEVLYCIGCIVQSDKSAECRRAAVLVSTLLLRGLGRHVLVDLGRDLLHLYRALKNLRDNDGDDVLRLHAQLALEEIDDIVKEFLFTPSKLEKTIFLLPGPT